MDESFWLFTTLILVHILFRKPYKSSPQPELPQAELPQTELPQAELPQTELPQTELPQAELPQTELPQTELLQPKPVIRAFIRRNLVKYQPNILVGNLNELVKDVEDRILLNQSDTDNDLVKERNRFICVVNPPRHGKSLFLDKLFSNRNDMRVVAITYNDNTNLGIAEKKSFDVATYYFWLRFIHSVTNYSTSIDHVKAIVGQFNPDIEYNLRWAKQVILNIYNMDPFTDDNGDDYPLVIAVDEFSKLIDAANDSTYGWSPVNRTDFITSLQNVMQTRPFVRFVCTGFNRSLDRLLDASSAPVYSITLTLCDFSSAKPLLRAIVNEYDRLNLSVPVLLYEVVKSTPGLVGLWAERLFFHATDNSLNTFADALSWAHTIRDDKNLTENWNLLMRFLVCSEADELSGSHEAHIAELNGIGNELISRLIGIVATPKHGSPQPFISPFCMVLLIERFRTESKGLELELWQHLRGAIRACEQALAESRSKDGRHYEDFFSSALKVRVVLSMFNKSSVGATFRFRHLFPADASRTISGTVGQPVHVHCVASKESLSKLLTPPLYFLFPIGLASLNDHANMRQAPRLTSWVNEQSASVACDWDPELLVLKNWYTCRISLVNTTNNNAVFSSDDELYIKTSPTLPEGASEQAQKVWYSMQATIKTIMSNLDCSIFPCAQGAAGCDLVLLAKEVRSETLPDADDTGTDEDEGDTGTVKGDTYHIIAVELKDRRGTEPEEWEKKIGLLTSYRCIVPRLRAALKAKDPSDELVYHILLAGREHSS